MGKMILDSTSGTPSDEELLESHKALYREAEDRDEHTRRIDRTNVALILVDAYSRLNQLYGARYGHVPEAETAWQRVEEAFALVMNLTLHQARYILQDISSDRADSRIGERNQIFNLTIDPPNARQSPDAT